MLCFLLFFFFKHQYSPNPPHVDDQNPSMVNKRISTQSTIPPLPIPVYFLLISPQSNICCTN